MEFFRELPSAISAETLQASLTIDTLPRFCAAIDTVLGQEGERGEIYCLWGQFQVTREPIRNGVRFALPDCINALSWTITSEEDGLRLHCTINRPQHDPDFIESIELFLDEWARGLSAPGDD